MYYLCVEKRENMHRVRILSFVLLIINDLHTSNMYM